MNETFDVVILGAGPAGEVALNTLAKAGAKIALVERELIGGECSNWGCIPSKTLLRPTELKGESARAYTIRVHAASQAAREKIEAAGGSVEIVS